MASQGYANTGIIVFIKLVLVYHAFHPANTAAREAIFAGWPADFACAKGAWTERTVGHGLVSAFARGIKRRSRLGGSKPVQIGVRPFSTGEPDRGVSATGPPFVGAHQDSS